MPRYAPLPTPQVFDAELRVVVEWIDNELRNIRESLDNPEVTTIKLSETHAALTRVSDGIAVYADGTDWNPGAGEGFYGRQAGAWVKL